MGLLPSASDVEQAAEKAEDHLSNQVVPAILTQLSEWLAGKKVVVTLVIEDRPKT